MRTIGNILWFILGGFIAGTIWVLAGVLCCVTIVGIPFGTACFRIASFAYWPFGKELVDARDVGEKRIAMTGLANFLWVVFIGLWTSIGFIFAGVAMFLGIVTIPFGIAYFKLAAAGFAPLGKRIVSTDMARVIRERKASAELDQRLGPGRRKSSPWKALGIGIVTVAIIGLITSVARVNLNDATRKTQIKTTKCKIESIRMAVERYKMDTGKHPGRLQNLLTKGNEEGWDGPYLMEADHGVPTDSWNNEFQYSIQGNECSIVSAGPDGAFGTEDDVK